MQENLDVFYRSVDALTGAKAKRGRIEVCLENRLEDALQCGLYNPILHGWDAQGAKLPRLPDFGDQHSPNRARPVCPCSQIRAQSLEECLYPTVQHHPYRD